MKHIIRLFYIAVLLHCSTVVHAQWAPKSVGNDAGVTHCFIESSGVLLSGGNGSSIYASTNNGDSWVVSNSGITNGSEVVCFGKNAAGIFAGGGGKIYFSNNTGASWSISNSNYGALAFAFLTDTVFAASMHAGVLMSVNNGTTWAPRNTGLGNDTVYSIIAKGNLLFAGTFSNGIFVSSNAGGNWLPVNTGLPLPTKIRCLETDGVNIYAGTVGGGFSAPHGMFVSSNDGASWSNVTNGISASAYVFDIKSIGNSLLAASGHVYRSLDQGASWNLFVTGVDTTCPYGSAGFYETSDYVFWGVEAGCSGGIYRINKSEMASVIESNEGQLSFSILPNPAYQKTVLRINNPTQSVFTATIYDMSGRAVSTISITKDNVELDLEGLTKGVYLIQLKSDKKIATKKLILE